MNTPIRTIVPSPQPYWPQPVDRDAIHRVIQRLRTFGMVESARELEVAIGEGEK